MGYHWAIKIGEEYEEEWFEIAGVDGKMENGTKNCVLRGSGSRTRSGVIEWVEIGTTSQRANERHTYIESWLQSHPDYNVHGDNCQLFVNDFAVWLCGPEISSKLPHYDHLKLLLGGAPIAGVGTRGALALAGSVVQAPVAAIGTAVGVGIVATAGVGLKTSQYRRGFNSFPAQEKFSDAVPCEEMKLGDDGKLCCPNIVGSELGCILQ